MKDEKFYDKKGKIKGSGIVTSRDEKRKGIDNSVDMSKMNRQNSYDAYKEDVNIDEGKITKWLTAPSRKRALANKMRQHAINILKNKHYKKAGDLSGEDNASKDPTGHGRSYLTRGYKETGEKNFSKSSKINYPDSDKHNRPVINNGPELTAMRKKLTDKYRARGDKAMDHSQKWWKKAEKLDPLEEGVVKLLKKKLGFQRRALLKKADNDLANKGGSLKRVLQRYKRSEGLDLKDASMLPKFSSRKNALEKEVKRNSGPSGDDFQPTSRSARLLKKLHEGGIKDLVTKDQEEKRLLKTDKPQKVLTDKERAKLKALKKINEAKWGSIDDREPSKVRKDGKITKKSTSLLKKKIKANLKGRIPGKNVYDHMKKYENGPLDEAKKSVDAKKKTLSQKDEHDKKIPNSLASYRERIARGRHYARNNDGKLDEAKKLYIRPVAKPGGRTKRNQKAFERAFGKNTKSFLDTLRDEPKTDDKK